SQARTQGEGRRGVAGLGQVRVRKGRASCRPAPHEDDPPASPWTPTGRVGDAARMYCGTLHQKSVRPALAPIETPIWNVSRLAWLRVGVIVRLPSGLS